MPTTEIVLALEGDEVPLEDFTRAIQAFVKLLQAAAGKQPVDFTVASLQSGSAIMAVEIETPRAHTGELIKRETMATWRAVAAGDTRMVRKRLALYAGHLANVLNGHINAIRLTSDESEEVVRTAEAGTVGRARPRLHGSYGVVEGRVQTVSETKGLRFFLYDHATHKPVTCYMREGYRELMRDIWGREARAEGWVTRERGTARPVTVRDVTSVRLVPDRTPMDFLLAEGALPLMVREPYPEERIGAGRASERS